MEGVGVYVTKIHDKNVNSFKESHDIFLLYLILIHSTFLFLHIINKQRYFPEFFLTTEYYVTTSYIVSL